MAAPEHVRFQFRRNNGFSNKSKQIGIDSILKNNSAEIFFPEVRNYFTEVEVVSSAFNAQIILYP